MLGRARRLRRRSTDDVREVIGTWGDRLALLRPKPVVWIQVGGLALANWLTDAGVLAVSIYAVGAPVPWHALLLVYGSGIVVRSLGITPGGLGLVEGTLCLGLVGAGLHVGPALASVLLYRLISFWMVATAGWIVLLCLHRDRHPGALVRGRTAIPSMANPSLMQSEERQTGGVSTVFLDVDGARSTSRGHAEGDVPFAVCDGRTIGNVSNGAAARASHDDRFCASFARNQQVPGSDSRADQL
jgi:hypothetical protein